MTPIATTKLAALHSRRKLLRWLPDSCDIKRGERREIIHRSDKVVPSKTSTIIVSSKGRDERYFSPVMEQNFASNVIRKITAGANNE
jgi:hypothetical protein